MVQSDGARSNRTVGLSPVWRIVLPVAIAAGALALIATSVGGWYQHDGVRDCDYVPCRTFHEYGWPWAWRTDEPPERIQHEIRWGYNEDGYTPWVFGFTVVTWFTVLAPLLLVLTVFARKIRNLRRQRLT